MITMIRVTKKIFKILTKTQQQRVVILGFMMLIGGIMESISVSLMLPLITAVMNEDTWNKPWYAQLICSIFKIENQRTYIELLLLALIVIFILKNVYLLFEYYVQFSFIAKSRINLQKQLLSSYMSKPYEFFLNASSGDILKTIGFDTDCSFDLMSSMLGFYTEIIVAVILAITIIAMSPIISIGLIIILGIELWVIGIIIKPKMRRIGIRIRKETADANTWMLQSINGIKSIKVSGAESFFEDHYSIHADRTADATRKNQTLSNMPRLLIEAFTVTGVMLILFIMVVAGTELASIIPQLSAFMVAAVRLLPSVNRISTALNRVPFCEGSLDNIIKITNSEEILSSTDLAEKSVNVITTGEKITFKGAISFSRITFAYGDREKKIFDNASFEITKGQSVGIVGASGSGKTTAIDIILGLLEPASGQVLVDGIDIHEDMQGWCNCLAYIPQSIFLFDDSIRANVAFGINEDCISDDKVWRALEDAQLKEFVMTLPDGIDTKIGEAGVRLSGGQRQRIGIARALYNDPEILFFDEATSALDNETESAIMESIEKLKGNKTLVIIAHRLTTIENCDKVYRVVDGKVLEEID